VYIYIYISTKVQKGGTREGYFYPNNDSIFTFKYTIFYNFVYVARWFSTTF
jgi:hypothetical protein